MFNKPPGGEWRGTSDRPSVDGQPGGRRRCHLSTSLSSRLRVPFLPLDSAGEGPVKTGLWFCNIQAAFTHVLAIHWLKKIYIKKKTQQAQHDPIVWGWSLLTAVFLCCCHTATWRERQPQWTVLTQKRWVGMQLVTCLLWLTLAH